MTHPPSNTSIDELGDRLRKGGVDDVDLRALDGFRRSFVDAYEMVVDRIRRVLSMEPTGRPAKSTTSIIDKLHRETTRLSQVQDIAGCRLVVPDVYTQDQVVDRLVHSLDRAIVVDRRKVPSHGYRSVHIIASMLGKPIEIQVRTELQHLWAEFSEKVADVVDPAVKYGGGPRHIRERLDSLSVTIEQLETTESQRGAAQAAEIERIKADLRKQLQNAIDSASDLYPGDTNVVSD